MAQLALNYQSMDDATLASVARNGDREAFRAVMQKYNQRLFRIARAIVGSDHEAEDVLQEGYLRAFAAIASFRNESSLSTWLTTIILNEARGRLRKRQNLVDLTAMNEDENNVVYLSGRAGSPESEAGRSEARLMIERAVDRLPDYFRIVFILREVEGCTVEDTAQQLALNPQTVKTRLHRARRLLRRELEHQFSNGVAGVFPFLGVRCSHITERVLALLPGT